MHPRRKFQKERAEYVRGEISIHPKRFGFVQVEDGSEVFVPGVKLGTAMPGDRVVVRLRPGKTLRKNREGAVTKILERKITSLSGFFNGVDIVPRDERILFWFYVPPGKAAGAKPGDIVIAKITAYPSETDRPQAEIMQVLGRELTPNLESKLILNQRGFCEEFPGPVKKELAQIPDRVGKRDGKNHQDLTAVPLVTVDPVDAKDFDDAVAAKKMDFGYRLWVAIADVSHYVEGGTELDAEAYQRGTSVYLPDRAVPMLPEPISSGIASLRPEEDRLTMTAEMDFNHQGQMIQSRFYPALIRSRFRITYQELQDFIDRSDPKIHQRYLPIESMVMEMADLAQILYRGRRRRGALDLDLPEAKVKLDQNGEPIDIYAYPRLFANRLIEEFMLSANQAVAEFLASKNLPLPYRIHETPSLEKISDLDQFLSGIGFPLLGKGQSPENVQPRDFQKLLDSVKDRPISGLVSYLALRSMMQAKYSPENKGHFGLALSHYCHFTSPIRRYPDLITHRILKQALGVLNRNQNCAPERLDQACIHCSEQERASISAERDTIKVYQAKLMSKHLGEEFKGRVSGLTQFGVFVELERPMAEGLIPADQLSGYALNEKIHTAFIKVPQMELHLGDQVLVEVDAVNLAYSRIDLRLIGVLKSVLARSAQPLPEPKRKSKKKGHKPR